jgi:flagellar hook-length control protein FliK
VAGGLRWMLKGGSQEAQLQLHPDSLGQVTIHLRVEGGEVHARIWVTEASSVQAVQEGRPHLEASLKEQGLQLGSFDLQQGHRPFQEAPSSPAYPGQPVLDFGTAGQEAPAPPLATILNSRHVELYA